MKLKNSSAYPNVSNFPVEQPLQLSQSPCLEPNSGQLIDNLTVDLLTIEQVAGLLGKRPQTIKNWIARRTFPYIRIGNKNWVRREGLEAWLKQKEFKPWQ